MIKTYTVFVSTQIELEMKKKNVIKAYVYDNTSSYNSYKLQ